MKKKKYTITNKTIDFDDAYDVIVVGGGPSGCAAAIAAAREGVKTLLIEATGCLGGMGTSGLVPSWAPFWDQENIIYRGIAEEVLNRSKENMMHVDKDELKWVPIDAEHLKRVYDILVCESGAEILFHSFLCSVETDENGSVSEIIVSNKSGLTAYKGKVFIDCTGDGDLAAWAGAEFMLGDEESKELQPASLCFVLTNVDDYAYQYGPRLHNSNLQSPIFEMMKSGEFPRIVDSHCCNQMVGPGAVCFNAGHLWKVDNTEPGSISQSLIEGRKIAKEFQEALAKYQPKAFGNSFLAATGSLMGIRETRRIVGEYVLTEEDYLQRKGFYDEIGRNSYYIDIHHSEHESSLETIKDFDWEKHRARYGAGESYGIPFRCLVPKGLKNVLIAGRSVSCDRAVQGSIRVMPACLVMGEGAGAAASLMVKEEMVNTDLCGPKIKKLQKLLLGHGAYFRSSETL